MITPHCGHKRHRVTLREACQPRQQWGQVYALKLTNRTQGLRIGRRFVDQCVALSPLLCWR